MKKGGIFFCLLAVVFYLFPRNVLAQGTIVINDFPESVSSNSEFNIGFSVTGLEADTSYYAKSRLGKETADMTKGETLNDTTQQWLNDYADWITFPVFGANDQGNLIAQVKIRLKSPPEAGEYYLTIQMHRVVSGTNFDSPSVNITITADVTPTVTNSPTPEPTATSTPIPAPTPKAVYQINKAKDDDGSELSSVDIYVDDFYIHHQDNKTLTFCDGCHCDSDDIVDCNLGSHKILMKKGGYLDWSETRTLNAEDNITVSPVLNKIAPTLTPVPTATLTPTVTPTARPTPTPTIVEEGEVLASSSSEQESNLNLSNPEASKTAGTKNAGKNYLFPASAGILGLGFIGFSVFLFVKSKETKSIEDKTVV